MNYNLILIRYGELSLKSPYVRKQFESILIRNISSAVHREHIPHTITKERGRIYLETDEIEKTLLVLSKIFGITSFSPVMTTSSDLSTISKVACTFFTTTKGSFALRVTRTGTHTYTSQEAAVEIGSNVVQATGLSVNLTRPEKELFIEIRNEHAYLFTEKIKGVGGLPMGTQGKVVAHIDTPIALLASWYLLRRGCTVVFACSNASLQPAIEQFLQTWYLTGQIISVSPKNTIDQIQNICANQHGTALVTGHILSEHKTKVLKDIKKLTSLCTVPILHPLIAMEKNDIRKQIKEMGIAQ